MDDAGLVRDWLAKHRFQLALHGHQHLDWDVGSWADGWFLAISAGGSAGVGSYGRAAWMLPLGYQVILIDTPESGRRIRRDYDMQTRAWVAAGPRWERWGEMADVKKRLRDIDDRLDAERQKAMDDLVGGVLKGLGADDPPAKGRGNPRSSGWADEIGPP